LGFEVIESAEQTLGVRITEDHRSQLLAKQVQVLRQQMDILLGSVVEVVAHPRKSPFGRGHDRALRHRSVRHQRFGVEQRSQ